MGRPTTKPIGRSYLPSLRARKVPVNISKKLVDEIQRRVDESGGEFQNVEKFIEFVLTELPKEEEEPAYTPEEEEKIKERLRRLGYIQ